MDTTVTPPESSSVASRAMLAVALLIGFYLLAFGMVGLLLYIPYAEIVYLGRIHFQLAFFCLAGAVLILWGILPRRARFQAPGPLLTEREHPRLFAEIRDIATATGQGMPDEVYLLMDTNAWVMDRTKFLGMGRTRVMGIGLPLLHLLDTSQLRGVLAHEFGHFHSGDTKLGPWVYRTRSLIGKTLESLGKHSSMLQRPFVWYGNAFLRITHGVSRQQEYTADAVAASVVGSGPMIEGLTIVNVKGMAFDGYWQNEVVHVLGRGYRPPIVEGFSRYLSAPMVSTALAEYSTGHLATAKADVYDTHPSLMERVAALKRFPESRGEKTGGYALELLEDVEGLERQLLATLAGDAAVAGLKPLHWGDAARDVWIPIWKETLRQAAGDIAGVTPRMVPDAINDPERFSALLGNTGNGVVAPQYRQQYLLTIFVNAMAVALAERGWEVRALPGEEVRFVREDQNIPLFTLTMGLAENGDVPATTSPEQWNAFCEQSGIGDVDLGKIEGLSD